MDIEEISCKECLKHLKEYEYKRMLSYRDKMKIRFHVAIRASCEEAYKEFRRNMWGK